MVSCFDLCSPQQDPSIVVHAIFLFEYKQSVVALPCRSKKTRLHGRAAKERSYAANSGFRARLFTARCFFRVFSIDERPVRTARNLDASAKRKKQGGEEREA